MSDIEKISAAMELLENLSAAVLRSGEIIRITESFAEDVKKTGRERIYELIETGIPFLCGKYVYYADVSHMGEYSAAIVTKHSVFSSELNSTRVLSDLSMKIRTSVTGISADLDHTFRIGSAFGCMPANALSYIESADSTLSSLYGKTLMYDELMLYETQDKLYSCSVDLYSVFKGMARDISKIAPEQGVRISVCGMEDSFVKIRPDTLRIIFTAAVRGIMLMKYKPEYIDVNVFHNDTESGFTVTGGTLEGKRSVIKPLVLSKEEAVSYNTLIEALADYFCERFGGRYYIVSDDFMYHMGFTLPRDAASSETDIEKATEIKNNLYDGLSRFSYESSILTDAAKKNRYIGSL